MIDPRRLHPLAEALLCPLFLLAMYGLIAAAWLLLGKDRM